MSPKTQALVNEIVAAANAGHEIIPMFWQPVIGRSNTVSAAIRAAKARGLLVDAGVDGCGKPKYRAPIKAATHAGSAAIN